MKQYKFDRNYLNFLIENKDKLLNNDLIILVTYIEVLQDKLEAYENMRKLAIEYIKYNATSNYFDSEKNMFRREEDLLNILNKVGGSDEQK